MGRTHSNAFGKVNQFFDLDHRPVLKAVCARNEANVKAFAEQWGYESIETDWRKLMSRADIDLIDIASPNDTHAEIAIAAAAGRQDGDVREAARPQRGREQAHGRRRSKPAVRRTWSGTTTAAFRRSRSPSRLIDDGRLGQDLSLSRQISAGLDDLRRSAAGRRRAVAARRRRGRQRRNRRPARPLHRHGDVAERTD